MITGQGSAAALTTSSPATTNVVPAGARFRPRGHVLAVQYPAVPDPAREVEIRGLARQLGMVPDEPFDYSRYQAGRRTLPSKEILLNRIGGARPITVPRGHWFVVHPRPGGQLFEVLTDDAFRAAFDGPDRSADSEHDLAVAVAAEAHWQLGRQVELRVLDANGYTTGQWSHPSMQAVIADIRTQLHQRDAQLWEPVNTEDLARWDLNQTRLPVAVQVRPQRSRNGDYYPSSARHTIPTSDVRGSRTHTAGRALCETGARSAPLPLGPVTVAPPDCPRCLTHMRAIAERHGQQLDEPPPPPEPLPDESNRVGPETPAAVADLPQLGEGWRIVQYGDPDRWWLHHHDRIRGYMHRYTNMSGNKTGWEAFEFISHGRYRHLDTTSAASNRSGSSFLWRSVALAAWGMATHPNHRAANPTWTRTWRLPRRTS